jgi:hypothetical protein
MGKKVDIEKCVTLLTGDEKLYFEHLKKRPCFYCRAEPTSAYQMDLPKFVPLFSNVSVMHYCLCDKCASDREIVMKVERGLESLLINDMDFQEIH